MQNSKMNASNIRLQRSFERATLLRLLQDVAVALSRADSVDQAIRSVIRLGCNSGPWHVAHAYLSENTSDGLALVSSGIWYPRGQARFASLERASLERRFRHGEGMVGRVFETGRPSWIRDVRRTPRLFQRPVVEAGLRTALILPAGTEDDVKAVLELFATDTLGFERDWLSAATSIGAQLGESIARIELERRLADTAIEERHALSRELHDTVGQQVTALGLVASNVRRKVERESPEASPALERLTSAVQELKSQVRVFVDHLGPLWTLSADLPLALEQLAEQTEALHGVHCRLTGAQASPKLDQTVAEQMVYIAKEAVHNAIKHGSAKRIVIDLRDEPKHLIMTVTDDGSGFTSAGRGPTGMGLRIMRHRAGIISAHLKIKSKPQHGTVVRCVLPNKHPKPARGHDTQEENKAVESP